MVTKRRTKTKTKPKTKLKTKRTSRKPATEVADSNPAFPPQPNAELDAYLRITEQENIAKKRVAAFLERTLNVGWMRARAGSFETALLGGLRNLLAESASDIATGRSAESREAVCLFLFGLLSSLRTVFYREAMHARVVALAAERGRLRPTDEDTADAVFEARVFNNAAQRENALEQFRFKLALAPSGSQDKVDDLLKQARLYDAMNASKGIPKA